MIISYVSMCILFVSVQRLCDYVCDLLLEESNVQPVSTPVTVCGDIHGQVKTMSQSRKSKSTTSIIFFSLA